MSRCPLRRTGAEAEGGRATQVVVAALATIAVLFALAVLTTDPGPPSDGEDAASDEAAPPLLSAEAPPPATLDEPQPTPTAVPRTGSSTYVVSWSSGAAAAPTPWLPEPTPSPWPTRAPQPCVEYTWQWSDSPAVIGQIMVEIRVRNRCGRKLEALEVLFYASGIKDGDTIYSGQGNLLEAIYPDSVRTVMIALPGSRTFYDTVTVEPVRPPVR